MNEFRSRFQLSLMGTCMLAAVSMSGLQAQSSLPASNASGQYFLPSASVLNAPSSAPAKPKSIQQVIQQIQQESKAHQTRTAKQVLGGKNLAVLLNATRVQVFQLGSSFNPQGTDAPRIDGYTLVAIGKEQGKEFASRLAVAMVDDQIYRSGGSLCFSPHIAFRAWRGNSYVDVMICFHCGNLEIHNSDGGQDLGASLASSQHPSFVDLAREAFPGDVNIQSLDSTIYPVMTKGHRPISSVKN